MSKTSKRDTPQRALRTDFTQYAVRHAVTARRRARKKQPIIRLMRSFTNMKVTKCMRTVPGVLAGIAVIVTGGLGVYALTDWFDGKVTVTQKDSSLFSVDLSACQGPLPPGINQRDDRHNVQFKILSTPHASAQTLQQILLGDCENAAVNHFYGAQYPESRFSAFGTSNNTIDSSTDPSFQYLLVAGTIVKTSATSVTVRYNLSAKASAANYVEKTLTLAPNATFYDAGKPTRLNDVHAGDRVQFVAYSAGATAALEGANILDNNNVIIKSIFKTQYNDATDQIVYQQYGVEPLDVYNGNY